MTATGQLTLSPPPPALPLDPCELVDVDPTSRGQLYAALGLHSLQIGCVEQARRMVLAGTYDSGRSDPARLSGSLVQADRGARVNNGSTESA